MAVKRISITEFLQRAPTHLVLDVRSPGEYGHAHIPGAYSLPLFSDEERAVVGTTYKKQSRERAIKAGLDFFGPKMRGMIETVEGLMKEERQRRKSGKGVTGNAGTAPAASPTGPMPLLVHCWRGGMRSAGVAWLLDLYGFDVYTLEGGYKAYRQWVLEQFGKPVQLRVLGGYTGSGKTRVLHALAAAGQTILDLEALAHHKGSAFGALGEPPQPRQEMFENLLAGALYSLEDKSMWVEDESQRIGNLKIPDPFWHQMRRSPICFLEVPFEERLEYLTAEYGRFEKERLVNAVLRIQKRLGGLETKNALNWLVEDNHRECFRILLRYYDKWYRAGLENRDNLPTLLQPVPAQRVEAPENAARILATFAEPDAHPASRPETA